MRSLRNSLYSRLDVCQELSPRYSSDYVKSITHVVNDAEPFCVLCELDRFELVGFLSVTFHDVSGQAERSVIDELIDLAVT